MKTYSRKELVSQSISVFAAHAVSTLFATVDGQYFIHEDRAKLHNSTLKSDKVYEIDLDEAKEAAKEIDVEETVLGSKNVTLALNSNDAIKVIQEKELVEDLTALRAEEAEDKNRKTVLAAIDARIKAINTADTKGAGASEEE